MIPWENEQWLPGVLNKNQMIALHTANVITNIDIRGIENDASALDLHLSSEAFLMVKGSIKPIKKIDYHTILSDSYYAKKFIH